MLLGAVLLLAALRAQGSAAADYAAGRFEAARAALAAELAARGPAAPPDLRGNLALAALRVQRTGEAEAAAQPLADADQPVWRQRGEFLLGLCAWQRADQAILAAQLPDAEPMAFEFAVRSVEAAWHHWRRAAAIAPGDPAAARNAERAWRRLAEVRAARDAATSRPRPEPAPPPPPAIPAGPPEATRPELTTGTLSAAELARLRQRLQQKEREKQRLRLLPLGAVAGERDW
jgi:hypothetical protein